MNSLAASARFSALPPARRPGWRRPGAAAPRCWWAALALVQLLAGTAGAEPHTYAPKNDWSLRVGRHNESAPALDTNGNIYVTTLAGELYSIRPDSTPRWRFAFNFETVSTPAIGADGTIYFGCRNRHLYAVTPTGQLHWRFKTGNWVDASPALGSNGTIYFGSWDKKFYAVNPDGTQRWAFPTGGPVVSSAAIDRAGVIYFGSHDGNFYALQPDGTQRWKFPTEGAILSSPAIGAEGTLYFTSAAGYLYALNPEGTLRWKLHTGGITAASPVLGRDETIFLGINSNHCAVSAAGKLLWSNHLSPQGYPLWDWIVAAPVALADGAAITSGTDGQLAIYEGPGWSWHVGLGAGLRAAPVITADGTVYCVTTHTGLQAWTHFPGPAPSSWPMFRANAQRTGRVHPP